MMNVPERRLCSLSLRVTLFVLGTNLGTADGTRDLPPPPHLLGSETQSSALTGTNWSNQSCGEPREGWEGLQGPTNSAEPEEFLTTFQSCQPLAGL